ncbi:class I SAM-dependent methyltransferase [Stigmatella sp. ncwal1]|uniref:Class I SAM-dependent methyltransferase n=1 Tax=Stigmatella ashevillensis TaxID=2995309 RepID=A0ABT5DPJ6_9BACT|nr:class I SAM-dependent methyltransferase [Stigmatella ashevillena]MDC0714663.1 class I SAM-dependent methyltransferase [Stigmatella ashevillena]
MTRPDPFSVLTDARAARVLRRLHEEADKQSFGHALHFLPKLPALLLGRKVALDDATALRSMADKFIALERPQGAFCYQTVRALQAKLVVEFGTSFGVSTIWLAAAVRANGGGQVIGTEFVPEKAARAQAHIEEAGLADIVEIRVGDALETLRTLPGEVDMALIDGFPLKSVDVVKLLQPRLRHGAVVIADNVGFMKGDYRDYIDFMRDPRNGFTSMLIPFKFGTEYSVRTLA